MKRELYTVFKSEPNNPDKPIHVLSPYIMRTSPILEIISRLNNRHDAKTYFWFDDSIRYMTEDIVIIFYDSYFTVFIDEPVKYNYNQIEEFFNLIED